MRERAFLCGYDPVTERDFDYRRGWIEDLLAYLARVFAIDVGNYTSLSWFMARWKEPIARLCNAEMDTRGHFWDARFRSRELLDDEAVLTCSLYVDLNQSRAGMADSLEDSRHSAIRQRILAAKEREARASYDDVQARALDACRDFSLVQAHVLFADCYLAPIAVEGPLLTTDALLQTQQRLGLASGDVPASAARLILPVTVTTPREQAENNERTDAAAAAPASAPSADDRQDAPPEVAAAPGPGAARLRPQSLPRRASDVPFLAMALSEYLRIARTLTSRIVRERGEPSATYAAGPDQLDETGLHAALARWGINPAVWLAQFQRLDCQCTRALGTAERVLRRAREVAQPRFHGISLCRAVFATTPADGFT